MRQAVLHRYGSVALVATTLVLAASLVVPGAATAVPSASVTAKQAEKDRVLREIDDMRQTLAVRTNDYVELCQRLDRTRLEVENVSAEVIVMEGKLAEAEAAFTERAVQMYRRDRTGMLELLLSSNDIQDFMKRAYYLVVIGESDVNVITRLRQARSESLWLQQSLSNRVIELQRLPVAADGALESIEKDIDEAEEKAEQIEEDIEQLLAMATTTTFAGATPTGTFTPELIISETKFRNSTPMSAEAIQTFLEAQPGTLDTYRGKDHSGVQKSAAEMIWEASNAYDISPAVLLVKFQKEQSLLADASPSKRQLDWALGVGKTDSRTIYKYQGFGNQVWHGARVLDKNSRPWHPGITMSIDGQRVSPANGATYSLYKYTPHFRGNRSFWMLYWRYFGNPM